MKYFNKFYIAGEWVAPHAAHPFDVINPATEEIVGTIQLGNEHDVDQAVKAAKKAFQSYQLSTIDERIEFLNRLLTLYKQHYDEIAHAISLEMGSPITFSKQVQTDTGVGIITHTINTLKEFKFSKKKNEVTTIYKEPIGVCGLITPWNWPINQVALKVIPALATGCTVVLKPSELSPLSAQIFSQLIDQAGFPKGVYNHINGTGEIVGNAISSHPSIDLVSFTGSTRAGIQVAKSAADTVKRVTQELGGKSANIILDHQNFEKAVRDGVMKCYENSGQSCDAPSRMLIPKEKYKEAVEIAFDATQKLTIGDPFDEQTDLGPVVSGLHFNRIQKHIEQGIKEAKLVVGGLGLPDTLEKGYFVKPTIFSGVTNQMSIAREEIFGPVLAIIPFDSVDQAIEIANDTPYGLAACISAEKDQAIQIAKKVRAGSISINGNVQDYDCPFGGFKQSGNGRECAGAIGFEDYLEIKSVSA